MAVGTWPVKTTMGTESMLAVATPVTVLVAPGPEVTRQTPHPPGGTGISVRHVGGGLFMPNHDMANAGLGHFVVDVQNGTSRKPEDDFHPFPFKTFKEDLSSLKLHKTPSIIPMGISYRGRSR